MYSCNGPEPPFNWGCISTILFFSLFSSFIQILMTSLACSQHLHWGQILTHMKTICIKHIWSAVKTNITKLPLTDKGQLCHILCAPVGRNKACNKGGLCLSKATLCVVYQVQTICVWGIWKSYASVIAPSVSSTWWHPYWHDEIYRKTASYLYLRPFSQNLLFCPRHPS